MNEQKQALLLIGSAKHPSSTSHSLGKYLLERLETQGFQTETIFLHKIIHHAQQTSLLLQSVEKASHLIFSFPLYVDSQPYQVSRAMELIFEHYQHSQGAQEKQAAFIVNCGFPEAAHNCTALAICERFAIETGFQWAGGLSLGGGEAIGGESLEKRGGMVRNVMQALDIAADALAAGQKIPEEAINLMAKPFIPGWMYTLFGNMSWRREAKRHGVLRNISDCPFNQAQSE
ncbi:NADPH-dependent FMN reductase [Chloroherpeton thalassium ATCC 35110]|uniref:NADPH-dependent FMN reductase n=1 Tax=Chloroherpeton thalassium (strain ATCC 35110 / GB-78) TaxID=517418 RepID=B3QSJ5_CHLT3|nr:NAD(P)H-dependent oxidoreductase [Chloroherpeton thalassium]ACF14042.1 NADPH-dependent FMN reductase [Chloroherpeton thalassium ATCC 35110]